MPAPRHHRRRDEPHIAWGAFEMIFSAGVIAVSLAMWIWQSTPLASVGVGVVGIVIGGIDVYNSRKGKDEPHGDIV